VVVKNGVEDELEVSEARDVGEPERDEETDEDRESEGKGEDDKDCERLGDSVLVCDDTAEKDEAKEFEALTEGEPETEAGGVTPLDMEARRDIVPLKEDKMEEESEELMREERLADGEELGCREDEKEEDAEAMRDEVFFEEGEALSDGDTKGVPESVLGAVTSAELVKAADMVPAWAVLDEEREGSKDKDALDVAVTETEAESEVEEEDDESPEAVAVTDVLDEVEASNDKVGEDETLELALEARVLVARGERDRVTRDVSEEVSEKLLAPLEVCEKLTSEESVNALEAQDVLEAVLQCEELKLEVRGGLTVAESEASTVSAAEDEDNAVVDEKRELSGV
jgi:hypothetical protein